MRAYHLFDVETFEIINEGNTNVVTPQQTSIEQGDAEPLSELSLTTVNYYKGFQKMVVKHEQTRRKSGRAYGEDILFNKFIENKSMNAYYSPKHNLFIIEGSKGSVNGAVKRFSRYFGDKFKVSRSKVDFPYVIKHSNNVWGGWFGKIGHGSLKSAALFGDHVNLSEDFSRLDAAGTLTSLNCALTFEKKSFDFTITLNKTVVIMQHGTPEEDLDLLLALKPILYKEISEAVVQ